MVFLFPGVLFRKFYFSGQFGNQFEQGNLLERFLWSLFLSFVCLTAVSGIFYLIDFLFDLHPLDNINFKKISSVFQSLSENKFPNSFSDESEFKSFLTLIFIIYLISGSLGYVIHNIIRTFALDKYSVFKFKNNWHYLSQAHKDNGVNRKIGDVYTTFVDVLVKSQEKDVLYRGVLNNFLLDKENKLENIVLSNVYKFESVEKKEEEKINAIEKTIKNKENIFILHRDYANKKVFKKSIDGDLLVLSNENIVNINFTYIKTSNKIKLWRGYIYDIIKIIYFVIIVLLVILPFFKINIYYFEFFWNKFVFSILTIFLGSIILDIISDVLKIKVTENKIKFKDKFFIWVLFLSPYLWFFNLLSGIMWFFCFVLTIMIFVGFQSNDNRKS